MQSIVVAKDGTLGCGACFTGSNGKHIPATIRLLKSADGDGYIEPNLTAFSSCSISRSTRYGTEIAHNAGDHVALVYNAVNTAFSAVVVRCDTWAVQWGVERSACLADGAISHLANLCANTVCGVVTTGKGAGQVEKQRVFVATRFDVTTTSRKENKEWRHFLAAPQCVETGLEDEGFACIAAYDRNSFLILTLKGTLALVHLNVNLSKREAPFSQVAILNVKLHSISEASRLVVQTDEAARAYVAVYAHEGTGVQLVQIGEGSSESGAPTLLCSVTEFKTDVPMDALAFAGGFHICVCARRAERNVQLFGLVPGSAELEIMAFDVLTSSHAPLEVYYNDAAEHLVLLSSTLSADSFAGAGSAKRSSSIIEASLDFSSGPFSQAALSVAQWTSVANPYRHYGPQSRHFTGTGGEGEEEEDGDVQLIKDTTALSAGRWTPLTLCYALATARDSHKANTAIFSVETAPFLHTRLIKQWHNATAGLRMILGSVSPRSYGAVALPWNPRHVRRALRLLSQSELTALLHTAAVAIAASERLPSSVSYAGATTAVVDIALHVISLSRQMGAVLHPNDVKMVAVIVRASREGGHELFRYASRMELLMESCLQRRAMNRVLRRRNNTARADSDETTQGLEKNFYGISAELQTERTLHTRYTANAWAQHLAARSECYQSEGESALSLLARVQPRSGSASACALSDWRRLGTAPHQDPTLNRYEQTLL